MSVLLVLVSPEIQLLVLFYSYKKRSDLGESQTVTSVEVKKSWTKENEMKTSDVSPLLLGSLWVWRELPAFGFRRSFSLRPGSTTLGLRLKGKKKLMGFGAFIFLK